MTDLLFGADPEVFVKNKATGRYISAHGMVNGTKLKPEPCEDGAFQVDGMALEFNITPASNENEWVGNIQKVYSALKDRIGDSYELVATPSVVFDRNTFDAAPDEAKELGCDPDFNAWQGGVANPRPNNTTMMRTGAGHVHIGWTKDADVEDPYHIEACCMLTKQLDASIGLAAMYWDKDGRRRSMYGAAGAFRPKSYGTEYRVMSNKWLTSPELIEYVYKATKHATTDLLNGVNYYAQPNTVGGMAYHYQSSRYTESIEYEYSIKPWLLALNRSYGFPLPWKQQV